MKKLLHLSLCALVSVISNMLVGCSEPNNNDFTIPDKTYEDFYKDLEDTTIEMEVIIKDKRTMFYYSSNEEYFVTTWKYENGQEFGFIYDNMNKTLYTLDKGKITLDVSASIAEKQIENIFKSANFLFYLKLDKSKFEFVEQVEIANRICNKFRYNDKSNDVVYNIYIDTESSLCFKCVRSKNNSTELFFEIKKFDNNTNIESFKSLINIYNLNKEQQKITP